MLPFWTLSSIKVADAERCAEALVKKHMHHSPICAFSCPSTAAQTITPNGTKEKHTMMRSEAPRRVKMQSAGDSWHCAAATGQPIWAMMTAVHVARSSLRLMHKTQFRCVKTPLHRNWWRLRTETCVCHTGLPLLHVS